MILEMPIPGLPLKKLMGINTCPYVTEDSHYGTLILLFHICFMLPIKNLLEILGLKWKMPNKNKSWYKQLFIKMAVILDLNLMKIF